RKVLSQCFAQYLARPNHADRLALALAPSALRETPPSRPRARWLRRAAKPSENFRLIIPSADKELFLQDRCRRLDGHGFHCRPGGPRRKERIWGRWRRPRLLPPMETP